ncbi:nucleoporin protein Ndc1-Nup [Gymnopilus junonius]|uniref:Nucleoporin protein Ndc1-Nup n=1 Tax=Gymnopilus junonius TaxID=109634 RepID=A0A9P5N8V5_GYMJU|nr:nucleoporin protein Ndc1-Nup [Gymnopilus junonius]
MSTTVANASTHALVKSLFRHRLKYVLLLSALRWAAGGSVRGGRIWDGVFCELGDSALPVIVLRKVFLTRNTIKTALAQNSTRIAFVTYLASAVGALAIHETPHYLNGRLVFLLVLLVTSVAFNFMSYAVSNLQKLSKTLVVTVAIIIAVINSFLSISLRSRLRVAAALPAYTLQIPLVSLLLRPFTAHFLRGQWTLLLPFRHIALVVRAWGLATSTFLVWELADTLFEHIVSEPTPVSTFSPDANTTLVSGTTSSDRIYKFFAYAELKDLATATSAQSPASASRRSSIFGDQKTPLNLWSTLVRESLLLLGQDYQFFLRRGQPLPSAPAPTPVKPKIIPNPNVATPVTLLRQRVFRDDVQQPTGYAALDALAADGPLAKVVDGAATGHVPELFRSVRSPPATPAPSVQNMTVSTGPKPKAKTDDGVLKALLGFDVDVSFKGLWKLKLVQSLTAKLKALVPGTLQSLWTKYGRKELGERVVWFLKWWGEERKSRVVDASLPYRELDVVVVDVLSHLVCASLTEDTYGTVQRDIPRILEAFVSFLLAVEEYQIEISALVKPLPAGTTLTKKEREERHALEVEAWKAHEVLGFMGDGLKEGITRIVRTFGDKLLAFKFPPRIAGKLQVFMDYSGGQ